MSQSRAYFPSPLPFEQKPFPRSSIFSAPCLHASQRGTAGGQRTSHHTLCIPSPAATARPPSAPFRATCALNTLLAAPARGHRDTPEPGYHSFQNSKVTLAFLRVSARLAESRERSPDRRFSSSRPTSFVRSALHSHKLFSVLLTIHDIMQMACIHSVCSYHNHHRIHASVLVPPIPICPLVRCVCGCRVRLPSQRLSFTLKRLVLVGRSATRS